MPAAPPFFRNKYRVSPKEERTFDGKVYASKAEMVRAKELATMLRAGTLTRVVEQPTIKLAGGIGYRPDFEVFALDGRHWWEDVKGMETPEFKLKKRLWKSSGPGTLLLLKRRAQGWKVDRVVPDPQTRMEFRQEIA